MTLQVGSEIPVSYVPAGKKRHKWSITESVGRRAFLPQSAHAIRKRATVHLPGTVKHECPHWGPSLSRGMCNVPRNGGGIVAPRSLWGPYRPDVSTLIDRRPLLRAALTIGTVLGAGGLGATRALAAEQLPRTHNDNSTPRPVGVLSSLFA